MAKTILLIHGRDFKPPEASQRKLWLEALRFGLERDFPEKLTAFDKCTIEFICYGHVSNAFLAKVYGVPIPDDTESRRATLAELKNYKRNQFNQKTYERLPGADWKKEAFADVFSGLLSALSLSDDVIKLVAPDMREYWHEDTAFGTNVRYPMIDPLRRAMQRDDEILVIAHSLGTMIAYDTFWKFCHTGEYRPEFTEKKIHFWITLGSPLADETVKKNLKGAGLSGPRRYPNNIVRWVNVAAEDDYVSHDQTVANDYRRMLEWKLIKSISDKRIYNLSVRHGKSNPHHELGYLIHPVVSELVARWL